MTGETWSDKYVALVFTILRSSLFEAKKTGTKLGIF